jgi:hypothetical protein
MAMITLVILQTGFLLGYMGMALMKYAFKHVRGHWEVRDVKDRLTAITMRWPTLSKKIPYNPRHLPMTRTKLGG